MTKEHYTYILKCSDDTLYIGYTNNLEKRMIAHNNKKGAKYTRGRTPIELLYYEQFSEKGEALRQEHSLKKLKREQKDNYILENLKTNKKKIISEINKNL